MILVIITNIIKIKRKISQMDDAYQGGSDSENETKPQVQPKPDSAQVLKEGVTEEESKRPEEQTGEEKNAPRSDRDEDEQGRDQRGSEEDDRASSKSA